MATVPVPIPQIINRPPLKSAARPELRVLQVFSALGMGGAETWLLALLKYFRDAQDELPFRARFDILLTGGERAVFDDEAIALGARLFYVPFRRRKTVAFAREFRRILANGNYHAIHDHQDYIAGLHFLMGGGHLPPIRVAHVHSSLYHRTNYAKGVVRRTAKAAGKRLVGRLATHIMGTSRQIVTEYGFDDFNDVAVGVTHCGFDVTQYQGDREEAHAELCRELGWPTSARVILFVGRLQGAELVHLGRQMNHKNPQLALDMARNCMARDDSIRLLMVGTGETKRRELEARANEWGLEQKIRFLGVRRDVPRLMLGSDLLLVPSVAEALGMVVVEAQAAGLRVLASDTIPRECVVIPELVGFLSLSLSPCTWADVAMRLSSMPPPDTASCNSALRNSPYSIDKSAAMLLSIYDCA